jgi:putative PIN family toxin of toxin-antitoxin system
VLRVTADTNIWISAFNYGGNPRKLIGMAEAGKLDLVISDAIIEETRRILGKRFGWPPEDIEDAEAEMRRLGRHITPRVTLDVVKDDPADNRIVECAVSAGSDFIVTGDKDLLRLGLYDAIRIVTVTDFLSIETQRQG